MDPDFAADLSALTQAYPDIDFASEWDGKKADWVLVITAVQSVFRLFYADGRYLTSEQLENPDRFRRVFYRYSKEMPDPSSYPRERIERMREYGTAENRMASPVTSPALFDAIYDSATRASMEDHLTVAQFLGQTIQIHEKIYAPLKAVEAGILGAAKTDADVAEFVETIGHISCYNWRQVRDTTGKSFHSIGIAVDIMPKNWVNEKIYWVWERESGNPDWMILPLEERWMPPAKVIEIFEDEGFIWGGKWFIWDNMHFEYRPELLLK